MIKGLSHLVVPGAKLLKLQNGNLALVRKMVSDLAPVQEQKSRLYKARAKAKDALNDLITLVASTGISRITNLGVSMIQDGKTIKFALFEVPDLITGKKGGGLYTGKGNDLLSFMYDREMVDKVLHKAKSLGHEFDMKKARDARFEEIEEMAKETQYLETRKRNINDPIRAFTHNLDLDPTLRSVDHKSSKLEDVDDFSIGAAVWHVVDVINSQIDRTFSCKSMHAEDYGMLFRTTLSDKEPSFLQTIDSINSGDCNWYELILRKLQEKGIILRYSFDGDVGNRKAVVFL